MRGLLNARAFSETALCSSTGSEGEEGDGVEAARPRLTSREKLALAEAIRNGSAAELEGSLPTKGLFAMPFMRRALKQQAQQVAADAADMLRADDPDAASDQSSPTPARQAFGGGAAVTTASAETRVPLHETSSGDEDEDREAGAQRRVAAAAAASTRNAAEAEGRTDHDRTARSAEAAAGDADRRARIRERAAKIGIAGQGGDGDVLAATPSTVIQVRAVSRDFE